MGSGFFSRWFFSFVLFFSNCFFSYYIDLFVFFSKICINSEWHFLMHFESFIKLKKKELIGIQNKIDLTCTIKVRPFRPTTCWRGRTWFVIVWTFTYNCFITNTIIIVICKELFSCWRCKWDAAVVSVSEEQDSINMHYRYNAMKKNNAYHAFSFTINQIKFSTSAIVIQNGKQTITREREILRSLLMPRRLEQCSPVNSFSVWLH